MKVRASYSIKEIIRRMSKFSSRKKILIIYCSKKLGLRWLNRTWSVLPYHKITLIFKSLRHAFYPLNGALTLQDQIPYPVQNSLTLYHECCKFMMIRQLLQLKKVCKTVKSNILYGLYVHNYRVGILSTFYIIVSKMIRPSLKSIGQF